MIVSFSRFYGLLNHSQIKDVEDIKETLVKSYTNGRTTHLHEMRVNEYEAMCNSLTPQIGNHSHEHNIRKKWRSTCLRQLTDIGIDTSNWRNINAYVSSKKLAGKVFKALTVDELKALSVQLRMIKSHQEK